MNEIILYIGVIGGIITIVGIIYLLICAIFNKKNKYQ